jgi:hypothetical protein
MTLTLACDVFSVSMIFIWSEVRSDRRSSSRQGGAMKRSSRRFGVERAYDVIERKKIEDGSGDRGLPTPPLSAPTTMTAGRAAAFAAAAEPRPFAAGFPAPVSLALPW